MKQQLVSARSTGNQSKRGWSFGGCSSLTSERKGIICLIGAVHRGGGGLRTKAGRGKEKEKKKKDQEDQISFKKVDVCDLGCLLTIYYCSSLLQDSINIGSGLQLGISGLQYTSAFVYSKKW